ncbi:PREDICTED: uncharacterized protein LOC108554686 [Eufriesea mexicana]|uniref:uncharacterized protein LOC108554686 n=1 Tax=Eufriesea mexicana TaxID=516756 RepID=UPI00083BC7EE|nr:PREDICTED: uncharacterized protein LOC108554686 [Eufriesea mexicana]
MAIEKTPKIEAQVVEAIRRLQAIQGSTPREISSYIAQEYNIPSSEIRRHVHIALKRGVTYGILQRLKGGCYTYNQDFFGSECLNSGDADVQERCKRRRRKLVSRRRSGRARRRSRRRRLRRRRRKSSGRRRKYGKRRREAFPKEIVGLEMTTVTKQPTKSSSLLAKDTSQSNHSTISGDSEAKQE